MILLEYVNAYMAVEALMGGECCYKTAHALVMLKKQLAPHAEFFAEKELKLVERFAEKDGEGRILWNGGSFSFREGADPAEYARSRTELGMMPVEEEIPVRRVPAPATIKPVHLAALEKFIEFEEADG